MRYVKALGFAATLATIATAFVGASAASAYQLCVPVGSGGDGKCPTASTEREIKQNESITYTSSNTTLTSSITNVICHETITVKLISANTASPLGHEVTALSSSNCKTSSGTNCTSMTRNLPYSASSTNSAITITDPIGVGFQLQCGFLINCQFLTKEMSWSVSHSGGSLQTVAVNEKLIASGGFCPETSEWDGTYASAVGYTII